MKRAFLSDLEARGLVRQMSSPEKDDRPGEERKRPALPEVLASGRVTGYIGFDPTAPSLHVGSLLPVLCLTRFQRAGHRPIAIVGGGTGLIGDPSGKDTERTLLTQEKLAANVTGLRGQLERFLDFGKGEAVLIDNSEWLCELALVPFLRDIGKHFSINTMIGRDSVKRRLETGLSFTEFSYMLLQAYDFLVLYDRYGCTLQMGGSDQWGNILAGCDLIRRTRGADAYALTFPLVERADGKKFGKSEHGNVWLDETLTSPYEFYQFWFNTPDSDAPQYLRSFTLMDLDTIDEVAREHSRSPEQRHAQRVLAAEVTRLVHGQDALSRVEHTTNVLFGDRPWTELSEQELEEAFAHCPSSPIERKLLGTERASIVELLVSSALCPSRRRAREDVEARAIRVNGCRVLDASAVVSDREALAGGFVVLQKGRKTYHVLHVSRD